MTKATEVYSALVKMCTPAALPGAWSRLPRPARFLLTPAANKLQESLSAQFSDSVLRESGIVVPSAAGKSELHSAFGRGPTIILPLYDGQETPIDLLLPHGESLAGEQLPLTHLLRDQPADFLANQLGRVPIVPSLRDMQALAAIGVHAVPAAGLSTMTRHGLDRFATALNLPDIVPIRRAEAAQSQQRRAPLNPMLAGWSLARLSIEIPVEIESARRHLANFTRYITPDLEVRVWRPSAFHLRKIVFALACCGRREIAQALLESVEDCSWDASHSTPYEPTYEDHVSAWLEATRSNRDQVVSTRAAVTTSYRQTVLLPLARQARKFKRLEHRVLAQARLELIQLRHELVLTLLLRARQEGIQPTSRDAQMTDTSGFRHLAMLQRDILAMTRALSPYTPIAAKPRRRSK